ncbi:MAG: hypothetical protein M2R45_01283 [Verrucomicrobia subdivision 3 bacterium]|nr:hypothetical protein [Limisphaerales bacterium]MCS1415149.1 hypothetical protein [Limisphaerales bacterium]
MVFKLKPPTKRNHAHHPKCDTQGRLPHVRIPQNGKHLPSPTKGDLVSIQPNTKKFANLTFPRDAEIPGRHPSVEEDAKLVRTIIKFTDMDEVANKRPHSNPCLRPGVTGGKSDQPAPLTSREPASGESGEESSHFKTPIALKVILPTAARFWKAAIFCRSDLVMMADFPLESARLGSNASPSHYLGKTCIVQSHSSYSVSS